MMKAQPRLGLDQCTGLNFGISVGAGRSKTCQSFLGCCCMHLLLNEVKSGKNPGLQGMILCTGLVPRIAECWTGKHHSSPHAPLCSLQAATN